MSEFIITVAGVVMLGFYGLVAYAKRMDLHIEESWRTTDEDADQ